MRNTTQYGQAGTITFRRSSSSIMMNFMTKEKRGTNLQNIEKDARHIYKPDKGKIFCQVDQSGAEALIVAYLCRSANFRSLFLNSVKPHVFVALHLFSKVWEEELNKYNKDIRININDFLQADIANLQQVEGWKELDKLIKSSDNWPSAKRYYYIAKQVCHSSNYGINPPTFRLNVLEKSRGKIVLSKTQAEDYLLFYHSLFPEIHEWHRDIQQQIEATRTLYNLQGYPRYFSGPINEATLKEAYAFIPQSTVGCITAIAFTNLQSFIEQNNLRWDILADTHDSFLVQCPEGEEVECCKIMKAFMEQELTSPRNEKFRMKSEAAVGYNWAPYKPLKNPEGLQ